MLRTIKIHEIDYIKILEKKAELQKGTTATIHNYHAIHSMFGGDMGDVM